MKWSELTWKERKQIYDTVRADNPNVSYLDIKQQFDNIPEYENGKEGNPKLPVELGLTPGTPEYFARQQRISGRADVVQPEAHLTPAGVIKDAISFGENVKEGNYTDAAIDAALTVVPVGIRKVARKWLKASEAPTRINRESKSVKKKTEADYDSEFSEVLRRDRNIKEYEKEISQSINTAISSDPKVRKLYDDIDAEYGTNYTDAIKRIAMRDMTNRGKYVKYEELPNGVQGRTSGKDISQEIGPTINNFTITLDPLQYVPGTANHELGHLADQLSGNADNDYLYYLRDMDNVMDYEELMREELWISPKHRAYLLDPQEGKAHMQHLKRSMIQQGKLANWSDNLTQLQVEDFLNDARNQVNGMNKVQYNMYRNKSRFIDRMNHLIPIEYAVPLTIADLANTNNTNNN